MGRSRSSPTDMPVVFIATKSSQYDKVINNIEEVRARSGSASSPWRRRVTPTWHRSPNTSSTCPTIPEPLQPMVTIVPLQLLAYRAADAPRLTTWTSRGTHGEDVTVE